VLGGGLAGLVHLTKAKVRLFSSVTTAGLGNPAPLRGRGRRLARGSLTAIVFPLFLLLVVAATLVSSWSPGGASDSAQLD